jgi:Protein of unknown function (DUF1573)
MQNVWRRIDWPINKHIISHSLAVLLMTLMQVNAQDAEPQVRTSSIEKAVNIGRQRLAIAHADVPLGDFRPGTVLKCMLLVTNEGDRNIQFNRVESGCSCLSVSPRSGALNPGQTIQFEATRVSSQWGARLCSDLTVHCSVWLVRSKRSGIRR